MSLKDALKKLIEHLDAMMEENPSRELADVVNFLQVMLEEEEKK